MLLRRVVMNIDSLCPLIKVAERICFQKDLVKNWNDPKNLKIDNPKHLCKNISTDPFINDFRAIEKDLNWINPSHLNSKYNQDMVELGGNEYGMKTALLVGDKALGALLHNEDIEVGYAYFKAGWFYPLHCHKTEELYHILQGRAMFGKEQDNRIVYKSVKPGDTIFHTSYLPHAMCFGDDPVLSIYLWYRKGRYYFIK